MTPSRTSHTRAVTFGLASIPSHEQLDPAGAERIAERVEPLAPPAPPITEEETAPLRGCPEMRKGISEPSAWESTSYLQGQL